MLPVILAPMRASWSAGAGLRPTALRSVVFFFSSRRRHTRLQGDWSSDVCSSDLNADLRQASRASARVAERRALPLTLALLLVAFGSLVAAGTPVVSGVLVIVLALGASGMLAAR